MAEQGNVIPIFRSEAAMMNHSRAAGKALRQAIANLYPAELYAENTSESQTADALDTAVYGFFDHNAPIDAFPIFKDKHAREILWHCIHNMQAFDSPEPYAHIEHLQRALYSADLGTVAVRQQPARLRTVR